MLTAILGSKIYRSSTRKDKIVKAFEDPINIELVKQLTSYIDLPDDVEDEYKEDFIDRVDDGEESDVVITPSGGKDAPSAPRGGGLGPAPSHSSPSMDFSDPGSSDSEPDDTDAPEEDVEVIDVPDTAESNTSIKDRASITSSVAPNTCPVISISDQIDSIQGLLNSRDDTAGVVRILVKDTELWIYYNDKINLNSVMEAVIALFNRADYSHLEFNRLARTDNAIVFLITMSSKTVEPEVVEDNE